MGIKNILRDFKSNLYNQKKIFSDDWHDFTFKTLLFFLRQQDIATENLNKAYSKTYKFKQVNHSSVFLGSTIFLMNTKHINKKQAYKLINNKIEEINANPSLAPYVNCSLTYNYLPIFTVLLFWALQQNDLHRLEEALNILKDHPFFKRFDNTKSLNNDFMAYAPLYAALLIGYLQIPDINKLENIFAQITGQDYFNNYKKGDLNYSLNSTYKYALLFILQLSTDIDLSKDAELAPLVEKYLSE
ncbi:hypothetical protein ACFL5G_03570 [Candidatus Margulisiibacteriota bacterium]